MMNKLFMWGAIILIMSVIIFPVVYIVFSIWWLFTGEMVTRLTFFITSLMSMFLIVAASTLISLVTKVKYRNEKTKIQKLKDLFNL